MRNLWCLVFLSFSALAQLTPDPTRFPWGTPASNWAQAPLNERCPNKARDSEVEASLVRNPQALIQHARSFGPACLRSVAEKYVNYAAREQQANCDSFSVCSFWNRGVQAACANAPASDTLCAEAQRLRERTTELTREMIFLATTHDLTPELTQLVCEQLDPTRPLAMSTPQGLQEVLQEMNCVELPVGQSRATSFSEPLTAGYVLERTGSNSYRARVNVNLSSTSGLDANALTQMEGRMRSCMAELRPVLKGPNGEQLELLLTNPTEVAALPPESPRPQVHNIEIHSSLARADSANYPVSAACPLIAHEVLHLLGLVDEYHETDPALGYQCRVHPERSTIMANHERALSALGQTTRCTPHAEVAALWQRSSERERQILMLPLASETLGSDGARYCRTSSAGPSLTVSEAALPSYTFPRLISSAAESLSFETAYTVVEDGSARVERLRVDCDCVGATQMNKCIRFHQQMPERLSRPPSRESCPPTMSGATTYGGSPTPGATSDGSGLTLSTQGSSDSLLAPGHFQSIIAGSCSRQAADYRTCASWAYRRECGERQSTCFGTPEQCSGPPTQCSDARFLGITPAARTPSAE